MDKMRVGFVGPGLMGHGAAKHILLKGFSLAMPKPAKMTLKSRLRG